MLDKSRVDRDLARRLCAAFISHQLRGSVATQYKKTQKTWVICGTSWPRWQASWQGGDRISCTENWDPWRSWTRRSFRAFGWAGGR
jgi:hypothetical protein